MASYSFLLSAIAAIAGARVSMAETAPLSCDSSDIPWPTVFGTVVTGLTAVPVSNYTDWDSPGDFPETTAHTINFCNVTITHTHPGWNDSLATHLWLPLSPSWNGRFMGIGGGGWATGDPASGAGSVALGYATASTDGGRNLYIPEPVEDWSLSSPGNPNWPLIQDFAAVGIDDMTRIGKAVTRSFYGSEIEYNYWYG